LAENKEGRISQLDGWRGISILLVLTSHFFLFRLGNFIQPHKYFGWLASTCGTVGVRTFFVISGFVIARQVLREEAATGSFSIGNFYIRRFFRIFPTYYLFLGTVGILGLIHAISVTPRNVVSCALYLTDTSFAHKTFVTSHSWSLAVEEQFYLVFPLCWSFVKPARRQFWLIATVVGLLIWSAATQAGLLAQFFSPGAVAGFSCIAVGVLVAMQERRMTKLAGSIPSAVVVFATLLLFARPFPTAVVASVAYVLMMPFCTALLLLHTVGRKRSSSVLDAAPLQWIGLVSYSAYVWQQLFLASPSEYGSAAIARVLHFPLLLPVVVAISYFLVEKTTNRLGRRISQRRAPASSMVAGQRNGVILDPAS